MRPRSIVPVVMAVVCVMAGCAVPDTGEQPPPTRQPPNSSVTPTPSPAPAQINEDPARFADPVVEHAAAAGINPVLLMAILYNESYKPHDPALERAWQKIDPEAAFGVANMHRAAFDDTRNGRAFADRRWEELPDDPDLAIQAAAWYLHDLDAQLPSGEPVARDDLLALGYNAGPGAMRAVAGGAAPGAQARSYVDRLHGNWQKAQDAVRGSR